MIADHRSPPITDHQAITNGCWGNLISLIHSFDHDHDTIIINHLHLLVVNND